MLWDNKSDDVWMQRLKNGIFLKMWVKNETRDAAMPLFAAVIVVILVIGLISHFFGAKP